MHRLNSSFLAWVEYDSGVMVLGLRNGRIYTLRGVPDYRFRGLINASSPGGYFNAYLRGRY